MRIITRILFGLIVLFGLFMIVMHFRAKSQHEDEEAYLTTLRKSITVSSGSFPPNGDMPVNCSCRGSGVSPALAWESNQADAEAYVVLVTDYDVPTPTFPIFNLSHWVLYNLPASVRSLPEALTTEQLQLLGGKIGKSSTGNLKFIAPCPPAGRHAYVFRVYALDEALSFTDVPNKQQVIDAMKGHILGYGELTGYFE
ncbi:YbhB/YbcL family Raf kinase inhibitor-like protein [Spirosoma endbachense]|uniref:YbhB/YbcL family Raf kinase inhibitor-like protein n=1 Tax=Spirosoma endbachense TaxID=2666025 RepID=A0A6P1W1U9_9BACT|nr:YbhB/YbcL family Raf kinase inhibitor-like protein [Spirosoma endbachense]QHV97997.1 YbhB/YbcL family Raf kinase inhibitor-like protein [Spirosoma endbachense]